MKKRSSTCLLAIALLLGVRSSALAAEPSVGECLTAYEEAIPLRNEHKLSAARTSLLRCAAASCPEDVRVECAKRVDELGAHMPTLVFEVRDPEGNDLSAVSLSMDGTRTAERLDGTAFELDPGEHEFVFSAPGYEAVTRKLVIREGEKARREKIVLEPSAPAIAEAPPEPEPLPAAASAPEPAPQPVVAASLAAEPDHTRQVAGVVLSALGVATLGVALYEQVTARNRYAESERAARSSDATLRASKHGLYEHARSAQTSAIVIAAIGAAALIPGAYLLLSGALESAPSKRGDVSLGFSADGGAVSYTRGF